MTRLPIIMTALAVLSGCGAGIPGAPASLSRPDAPRSPDPVPVSILEPQAGSDAGFAKKGSAGSVIGTGVVSLGDPRVAGLWVRAPFVEEGATVELHSPETGLSVLAEASRSDGFLQMSLGAFQALGLSPTGLPDIEVRTP